MERPFVSIVVPVLNGERFLAGCLNSLMRLEYPNSRREVIVVDNGSTDGSAEVAGRYPVKVIREAQRGLPQARNRGIAESSGEIVAFTDHDCLPSLSWLEELVRGLADHNVDAAGGEIVAFPPQTRAEHYEARRRPLWQHSALDREVAGLVFASAAVRREAFRRVGAFDPDFAGVGAEDIDWAMRFRSAGLRLTYRPRAVVLHRHRATVRQMFRQQMRNGRGQALLARKHPAQLGWGWRRELGAWQDIGATAWRAARLRARRVGPPEPEDGIDPFVDGVRKLAQRLGYLRQTLAR